MNMFANGMARLQALCERTGHVPDGDGPAVIIKLIKMRPSPNPIPRKARALARRRRERDERAALNLVEREKYRIAAVRRLQPWR